MEVNIFISIIKNFKMQYILKVWLRGMLIFLLNFTQSHRISPHIAKFFNPIWAQLWLSLVKRHFAALTKTRSVMDNRLNFCCTSTTKADVDPCLHSLDLQHFVSSYRLQMLFWVGLSEVQVAVSPESSRKGETEASSGAGSDWTS